MVAFGSFMCHIMIMTGTAKKLVQKRPRRTSAGLPPVERAAAARLAAALGPSTAGSKQAVQMVDIDGHRIDLPEALAEVIARAASLLAKGHKVAVLPDDEVLTTQQAANRLNVSRQYVVRLVDQGVLPSTKVGSHRRLRARDVDSYKVARDARRDAALDRLAALSEDAGGYQLGDQTRVAAGHTG